MAMAAFQCEVPDSLAQRLAPKSPRLDVKMSSVGVLMRFAPQYGRNDPYCSRVSRMILIFISSLLLYLFDDFVERSLEDLIERVLFDEITLDHPTSEKPVRESNPDTTMLARRRTYFLLLYVSTTAPAVVVSS